MQRVPTSAKCRPAEQRGPCTTRTGRSLLLPNAFGGVCRLGSASPERGVLQRLAIVHLVHDVHAAPGLLISAMPTSSLGQLDSSRLMLFPSVLPVAIRFASLASTSVVGSRCLSEVFAWHRMPPVRSRAAFCGALHRYAGARWAPESSYPLLAVVRPPTVCQQRSALDMFRRGLHRSRGEPRAIACVPKTKSREVCRRRFNEESVVCKCHSCKLFTADMHSPPSALCHCTPLCPDPLRCRPLEDVGTRGCPLVATFVFVHARFVLGTWDAEAHAPCPMLLHQSWARCGASEVRCNDVRQASKAWRTLSLAMCSLHCVDRAHAVILCSVTSPFAG